MWQALDFQENFKMRSKSSAPIKECRVNWNNLLLVFAGARNGLISRYPLNLGEAGEITSEIFH
jgi:hypothetical protein